MSRKYARQSRTAFTLVEILAVVVILGIASAVIIPQISNRDDLKAAAGTRLVTADLIFAQNRAIATQHRQYVKFDLAAQSYAVQSRNLDTDPLVTITHPITHNPFVATFNGPKSPSAGITIGTVNFAGQSMIGYDELGSPFVLDTTDPSGAGTIVLTTRGQIDIKAGSHTLTIWIEPFTGEATIP